MALAVAVAFAIIFVTAGPLSSYSVYAIAHTSIPPIFFWLLGMFILLSGIPLTYYAMKKNGSWKARIGDPTPLTDSRSPD